MNDKDEVSYFLNDASRYLEKANTLFKIKDFQLATDCSQLCIELSAKAIIAYYAEPEWTHNPSKQLKKILDEHKKEYDLEMVEDLYRLVADAEKASA